MLHWTHSADFCIYAKIGHVNQSTLRSCSCYFWNNMILSSSHKTMRFSTLLLPHVGICFFFFEETRSIAWCVNIAIWIENSLRILKITANQSKSSCSRFMINTMCLILDSLNSFLVWKSCKNANKIVNDFQRLCDSFKRVKSNHFEFGVCHVHMKNKMWHISVSLLRMNFSF